MKKKHYKINKNENEEQVVAGHHFVKKSLGDEPDKNEEKRGRADSAHEEIKSASKNEIQKKLLEIYENNDGSMPDMKNFTKVKRNGIIRAFFTLILSAVFLIAAVWVGLFILKQNDFFSANDVVLTIAGDSAASFGQVVNYKIDYKNTSSVPLARAELQVKYPEGFVFEESTIPPTADKKDAWDVGAIDPGAGGSLGIKGRIFGGKDDSQSFRVFLNYTPSNFNSEFQKVETLVVQVSEPLINMAVIWPEETSIGENVEFHILLNSTSTLNNVISVKIEPSANFTKKDSLPISDDNEPYRWTLNGLKDKTDIILKGSFSKEGGAMEGIIKVMIYGWKGEKKVGDSYKLAESIQTIRLAESAVLPLLVINGATDKLSVAPGDTLSSSLSIKNTANTAIKNVKIRFVIEAPAYQQKSSLNWSKLEDDNNGAITGEQVGDNMRRGVVEWSSKQVAGLAKLSPGAEVALDLSMPIKTTYETNWTNYTANTLSAVVEMEYMVEGEKQIVRSNPITMILNSDLGIEVRDKVSSDDQGAEAHAITWLLTNNFHGLKNITVEADVYGDVTWKDGDLAVPAGKVSFNGESKKVIWTIDSMPTDVDVLGLQFTIMLNKKNPSQSNLTSKVRVKALDTVTNNEIIKAGDEVLLVGGPVGN